MFGSFAFLCRILRLFLNRWLFRRGRSDAVRSGAGEAVDVSLKIFPVLIGEQSGSGHIGKRCMGAQCGALRYILIGAADGGRNQRCNFEIEIGRKCTVGTDIAHALAVGSVAGNAGLCVDLLATFRAADFVAINETEARELAGVPGIARATLELRKNGTRGVIVKLGEYGAAFRSADDYFVAPGFPLEEVVDPTGAGDAFAGGFLGHLARTGSTSSPELRRAMIYGSALGSFAVERFSVDRLIGLTREEIEERVRHFRELTSFEAALVVDPHV